MITEKSNNHAIAKKAISLVITEVEKRGGRCPYEPQSRKSIIEIEAPDQRTFQLRIKSKTKGAWQVLVNDDQNPPQDDTKFWVFIDLGKPPGHAKFYVMPEHWVKKDIYEKHKAYLNRNNGKRPVNDSSDHHSVKLDRLQQWEGRWDLLGLGSNTIAPVASAASRKAFIFTWNKDKWPEHEIQELVDQIRSTGEAVCTWKCAAHNMVSRGDRAFFSRTGQINPGLIGSGYIHSEPKLETDFDETKMAWCVDIRFDYLSESPKDVVISHKDLSQMLGVPKRAFTPQRSGISYPGDGAELENLWKRFTTSKQTFKRSDMVLLKEVGKSQYKDGVRIDKAFHSIFNPESSVYYTKRGAARPITVTFNGKDFEAEYRFEGTKAKEVDLQRIGFFKDLREEFKKVFPTPRGYFTIKMGADLNHFIFDYEQTTSAAYNQQLEYEITKSRKDTKAARLKRLAEAAKTPESVQVTSVAYKRNADVIVEVLERAKGKCEACLQDAPFLKAKDNMPYLEVHHKTPLYEGGEDTVANTIAVCPNCHRELHFG